MYLIFFLCYHRNCDILIYMKEPRTYYVKKTHQSKLEKLANETEKDTGISTSVSAIVSMIFENFFRTNKKKK